MPKLPLKQLAQGGAATGNPVTWNGTKYAPGTSVAAADIHNTNGSGGSDICVKAGTSVADASVSATAKIFSARTAIGGTEVEYFGVTKAGITCGVINQQGTDSSATPGNATINKTCGISAILANNSYVTITNSLAATASRILVTWYGDHGAARWWVVRAAGSFTVVLSSTASANTPFGWEVSSLS